MEPDDPASTPSDAETSQMPAVVPARSEPESVVWPEDPWVADGRAADDPTLENGPVVTSPVIPTWPESTAGEPSVPSHTGMNPTDQDPVTAPFPTRSAGDSPQPDVMKTAPPEPNTPAEPTEEVHDTVPPAPAAEASRTVESEEVGTADAALETLPPELAAVEASEDEGSGSSAEEAAIEAIAEDEPTAAAGDGQAPAEEAGEAEPAEEAEEATAPVEAAAAPVEEEEEQPAPFAAAEAESVPEPEPAPEPEPVTEPEPAPEPVKAEEPEPPARVERPVEPATPAAGTPVWAQPAQPAPPPAPAMPTTPAIPATPAAASPFTPATPAIPSWAPNAPRAAEKPQPEAPTQWPGINVPAWAPQPAPSHPGTANPLPGAGGPYADPVRAVAPAPAPMPAPAPAPAPIPQASAPAPALAPAPAPPAAPVAPTTATPKSSSSWEVVEQKRAAEPVHQGPTPEDKSYAEWFAWAKRSGAPAGACHAAAQGAFRALAAGHDMNTAVQWATLAMASPPGLVGQSRQIYCAWYSLGNIDLKLPTAQAHAFANGAIQALEQGADSMGAHQAGLAAAGITGG